MFDYNKDYIYTVHNFIDEEDINYILNHMKNYPDSESQREVEFMDKIKDEHLLELIKKYEKKAYSEIVGKYAPSVNLRIEQLMWMRRLELVKWNNGTGLPPHTDGHLQTPPEPELSLSSLIYLTDKYTGGEVYFEDYDLEIKPKRGDFIVFPSHFLHEVKQIHKNETNEYRCTIPFFYTFNARKFDEYTHMSYIRQLEDHNKGIGEYSHNTETEG